MTRTSRAAALAVTIGALLGPGGATGASAAWKPDAPSYGTSMQRNLPIELRDGTVLRADVYTPTDQATGEPAKGTFPVILTQTPYTKSDMEQLGAAMDGGEYTDPGYFASRGYIVVFSDVRGTGGSDGQLAITGPPEGDDGAQVVRWAAKLPHANGRVGLLGASWMGINQLTTAASVGKDSPLKAIFPMVAANDLYRDLSFQGGVPDTLGSAALLPLVTALEAPGPALENRDDPQAAAKVQIEHVPGQAGLAALVASEQSGGERSYFSSWWADREPGRLLGRIVRNGVPAFLVGGWLDVFQRGAPLNYAGLQNAWAGRALDAPMLPGQHTTPRYQLLMGPWSHTNVGDGLSLKPVALRWFDQWLKQRDTGILDTRDPLHLYDLATGGWRDASSYPLGEARPATYYLGAGATGSAPHSTNDGALSPKRPTDAVAADSLAYTGASSPCNRQTTQWSIGVLQNPVCQADDRPFQTGPGALTYTTAPMDSDQVLAGPIGATLYASSTTADAQLVVSVEDVAPDGTSKPLTSGSLLASMRALESRSWTTDDGLALLPFHPFTLTSKRPLVPGKVERLDVEVNPTVSKIAKGDRIRVTITSSDTPHLVPTPAQTSDLIGGTYALQRTAKQASSVQLPLAAASALSASCGVCATTG